LDKRDCFFIILILLVIAILTFRIIRMQKLLKVEEDIITIKAFGSVSIFLGVVGLIQLGFWIKGLMEFQGNLKDNAISSFNSTGLPIISFAIASIDSSFITKDGIIKLNYKYKWDSIEEWCWKKDHYNVAVFKAYVSPRFSKKLPLKLKNIELNVSQKQRNEVEELIIQYIGEEAMKSIKSIKCE
jgi:hypothetical protein